MEELKMIIDAMSGLGEDTLTAMKFWILAKYLLNPIVILLIAVIVSVLAYKLLAPVVMIHTLLERIKDEAGLAGHLTSNEKRFLIGLIRKGKLYRKERE